MPYIGNVTTDFNVGTDNINNGAVTGEKLSLPFDYDSGTLYLDSTNNRVGIGTTSPQTLLHLFAGTGTAAYATFSGNNGSPDPFLIGQDASGLTRLFQTSTQPITFWTNSTERLRLDSSGRLSLGTTSTSRTAEFYTASGNNGLRISNGGDTASDYGVLDIVQGASQKFVIYTNQNNTTANANTGAFIFQTGAVERMRLDASGRLGLGTSSPTAKLESYFSSTNPSLSSNVGAGLSVNGTSTVRLNFGNYPGAPYSSWVQSSDGAGNAYPVVLNPLGGLVGIGTTSPEAALDVRGVIQGGNGTIKGQISYSTRVEMGSASNHDLGFFTNSTTKMLLDTSGRLGIGTASPVTALQVVGTGTFGNGVGGRLQVTTDSNLGYIDSLNNASTQWQPLIERGTDIQFHTNTAGTTPVEKMRLDENGRLGLGTSVPGVNLEIQAAAGNSTNAAIRLRANDSSGNAGSVADITVIGTAAQQSALTFSTRDGSNILERLRIDSSGRLGVGTSSPYSRFTVVPSSDAVAVAGANQITIGESSGNSNYRLQLGYFIDSGYKGSIQVYDNNAASALILNGAGGNVGIGTTSPGTTLDVQAAAANQQLYSTTGTNSTYIQFRNNAGFAYVGLDNSVGTSFGAAYSLTLAHLGAYPITFLTNGSERARIDSSGSLLVGTAASRSGRATFVSGTNNTNADYQGSAASFVGPGLVGTAANPATISVEDNRAMALGVGGTIGFGGRYLSSTDSYAQWAAIAGKKETGTSGEYGGYLGFYTRVHASNLLEERMRIGSNGSTTIASAIPSNVVVAIDNSSNTSGTQCLTLQNRANANNVSSYYLVCQEPGVANRMFIYGNGNVANINNSYGAISDIKLKENIVDASPQWGDIKALRVRKYNLIKDQTHTQIGLVAQEVELVSPGLVSESPDRDAEGNDLGTTTKSVNYSVLHMKAVKALQEAMERIEQLETSSADLLARVTALEAS
jgi:hypothetical protein